MTVRLDHTIVPAKDKVASAEFFAEHLTFDFADEPEPGAGRASTPGRGAASTTRST